MKSNQKIEKQLRNKTNSKLVETIISAKKKKAWRKVAEVLSRSRKNRQNMNLSEINNKIKEGENVVIVGKVLSQGELNKKVKIIAMNFSDKAKEKIEKKGKFEYIINEIKSNPEGKDLKFLK